MKKLFLSIALIGMVSAVSASTVAAVSNTAIVAVKGDDKKGDDKKKDKKACAGEEKKGCAKGSSCCKGKKADEKKSETK
jgi:hypothetical protein